MQEPQNAETLKLDVVQIPTTAENLLQRLFKLNALCSTFT